MSGRRAIRKVIGIRRLLRVFEESEFLFQPGNRLTPLIVLLRFFGCHPQVDGGLQGFVMFFGQFHDALLQIVNGDGRLAQRLQIHRL
jgi:hypothetical protein